MLIARWQTRGGKHWYELFEQDFQGKPSYHYNGDNCGGNIGWSTRDKAIQNIQTRVDDTAKYDGINMSFQAQK